uniref:Uncharacterized protein n=1 Tax=Amphimedon queenslandica TaxID=400682 RepID=A0A1X7UMT4_AMPQE
MFGYLKLLWNSKAKEGAIENMIENGTKPREFVENPIERPTGTGKTYVIREADCQNPKGSLYFEISGVEIFPEQLAKAACHNCEAFIKLVGTAKKCKCWVYSYRIRCLEGYVMHLVHSTSSKTRVKVMEELELPEDKAVDYLRDKGLPTLLLLIKDGLVLGIKQLRMNLKNVLWDVYNQFHMGMCAKDTAEKYEISGLKQDKYTMRP